MNIVNPALFSRAFLFFAYPAAMSGDEVWVKKPFYENAIGDFVPSFWTTISHNKIYNFLNGQQANAVSGQTPLALATELSSSYANINNDINVTYSKYDMFFGSIPGSIGETSTFMCILGAVILIVSKVGSWRIMLGSCVGCLTTVLLFNISHISSLSSVAVSNHFIMGGFAFGTVFMATDPVSGPLQKLSKLIYGFCIGSCCMLIRTINPAFPEGMMMAILFLNIFSPLIDHYVTIYLINKRGRTINYA